MLVFALFAASNASSQTLDFDAVDVTITHVRGPIYVIDGLGGQLRLGGPIQILLSFGLGPSSAAGQRYGQQHGHRARSNMT